MLAPAYTRFLAPVLLAACFAAFPAVAAAEHSPRPFKAVATIITCGGESLQIAAEIRPSTDARSERVRNRVLKKIRRANLRVRFEATPLYGDPLKTDEVDLGRRSSGRRNELFNELPANSYSGVVRYRWARGKKTVFSGVVRTTKAKAAGRRGKAYCSLPSGRAPNDTTAPFVVPFPSTATVWNKGPLSVFFYAVDDLSGVQGVFWRVDNGPFRTGRTLKIETEGVHVLQYVARDVAGNQSKLAAVTLRVDTSAPTSPTISAPSGPTTDSTPDITWAASTDSGSGVQAYFLVVRNSSDAIIFGRAMKATDPTTFTLPEALPTGQYTAQVIALDGTSPEPFSTTATSSFSVVNPETATTADADGDGLTDGADNCPFASNADQADLDGTGGGDVCDDDDDGDAVADLTDNCPRAGNAGQENTGGSAAGDVCEDRDGDGVIDAGDNCKDTSNPAPQTDFNSDGEGDACDPDIDGDGVANDPDLCDSEPAGTASGCPAPTVTSSSPSNGGSKTFAQRADNLTVTFNRAMNAGTLDGAISLTRGVTSVPRTVTCNDPCLTATVNPGEDLGGSYTLSVSTAATSTEGNPLSSSYTASFTATSFATGFDTCTDYVFTGSGQAWECGGSQLRVLDANREMGIGGSDLDSVAVTAPVSYDTVGADSMQITYSRQFSIASDVNGDSVTVEVLRDGVSVATRSYTDLTASSSPSDTLAFNAAAGAHNYTVRFTLHLVASGLNDNDDVGDVSFDSLTLGRA